ncbi:hypothetical protein HanRHA438_Chr14g0669111 [Helianthus annuus]|nr:hypothetical protein HanRHA438_Chr14g0669111 [Helianthus annuus]
MQFIAVQNQISFKGRYLRYRLSRWDISKFTIMPSLYIYIYIRRETYIILIVSKVKTQKCQYLKHDLIVSHESSSESTSTKASKITAISPIISEPILQTDISHRYFAEGR